MARVTLPFVAATVTILACSMIRASSESQEPLSAEPTAPPPGISLSQADLPDGFEPLPTDDAADLRASFRNTVATEAEPSLGELFLFSNESHHELLFAFTLVLPDESTMSQFDRDALRAETLLNHLVPSNEDNPITESSVLPGADAIGDASVGLIATTSYQGAPSSVTRLIVFRQGNIAVVLVDLAMAGRDPVVDLPDLAKMLGGRLQEAQR